jgi:hypothetical protein
LLATAQPHTCAAQNNSRPAKNDPLFDDLTAAEQRLLIGSRFFRKKNRYRAGWLTRKGRRLVEAIPTYQRGPSSRATDAIH